MNPSDFFGKYKSEFLLALDNIQVTGSLASGALQAGVNAGATLLKATQEAGKKVIFTGNGGSMGISSHQSTDYWKNGGVRAQTFSDPAMLTCLANDIGYENAYSTCVRMFADAGDVLYAISSSGSSKNILNAVEAAREKKCTVVTFSGFSPENPLRGMGDLNFYVPAFSYGFVEILHEFISHSILDQKMYLADGRDVFHRNDFMK
jgi:D-sedoheptulose 7-phosphate isomerase